MPFLGALQPMHLLLILAMLVVPTLIVGGIIFAAVLTALRLQRSVPPAAAVRPVEYRGEALRREEI